MATQDDWHNTNLHYESSRALLSVTHSAQRTGDQCLHGRARAQSSCTTESIQKSRAPDRNTSAGNCGGLGGKLCFTNTVLRSMSDPQKEREAFARHHFGVDFAYWHLNSRLLSSIAHVQLINLQTVPPLYSTERVVPTAAVEKILTGLQEPVWRTAYSGPKRTPPCKHVAVHIRDWLNLYRLMYYSGWFLDPSSSTQSASSERPTRYPTGTPIVETSEPTPA